MQRVLISLVFMGVGFLFVIKNYRIVNTVGRNGWAETKLGSGGTYVLVQLIGIVSMTFGLLFLLGIIG